jgi:hypothetical protein
MTAWLGKYSLVLLQIVTSDRIITAFQAVSGASIRAQSSV